MQILSLFICLIMTVLDVVELVRMTLVSPNTETKLLGTLDSLLKQCRILQTLRTRRNDHRQHILMICEQLRHHLAMLLRIGASLVCTVAISYLAVWLCF